MTFSTFFNQDLIWPIFIFWKTLKAKHYPSVTTASSKFPALYPYTHSPSNTCISQLHKYLVTCYQQARFPCNLYDIEHLPIQNLITFLVNNLLQFYSHFPDNLSLIIPLLCFTIVQVFIHHVLHWWHYELGSRCRWINRFGQHVLLIHEEICCQPFVSFWSDSWDRGMVWFRVK